VPLVDLSMVEQRYDAVREVLDGAMVTDTATRYRVNRRTLHRWLVRYANEGPAALGDKSSRLDRCPTRWRRRSRPASSSYAEPTPAGAPATSSTGCDASSSTRRRGLRSIAVSCATA
jgi:transposase-like protein